jgi:Kae1-associated kinase Bud32
MPMSVIAKGAEATILKGVWHGKDVIFKERTKKTYRINHLDDRLRTSRTRYEAGLIVQARRVGVRTPVIFDIDLVNCTIVMEYIDGPTAKKVLRDSDSRSECARLIGTGVGRMHRNNLIHGDLTTSNIIMNQGACFIDFGLGEKSHELEKKGVDLHLLKEALESAHSEYPDLYNDVKSAYLEEYPEGKAVIKLVEEIQKRGRYT